MHRHILDAADTVPLALLFVVADDGAYSGKGVILEEHPPRFVQLSGLQQPNDLWDVGVNRTAFPASRIFTAETAVGFFHDMQCHILSP